MKGILGTKIGMTQIWRDNRAVPVTVVFASPNPVVQRKTVDTDGYDAVQVGFFDKNEQRINRPELGHLKKYGVGGVRYLRELRDYAPEGDAITVDIFSEGEKIDVVGKSKGRGTQGVMRRWNFSGGPASHGAKKWHRRPGSIGQRKTPGRVYKGKRMAGRWGNDRITVQNLEVVEIRPDENLILIRGSVPGATGGLLVLREAAKGGK